MKRTLYLLATLFTASLAQAAFVLEGPVNQAIPDGDLAGLVSLVTVPGQSGSVHDLIVNLSISGSHNGDLYAYLTHGVPVLVQRGGSERRVGVVRGFRR